MKLKKLFLLSIVLLINSGVAFEVIAQSRRTPSSIFTYNSNFQNLIEGDGYMVGGDLWTTVKPMNTNESNRLGSPFASVAGGMNNYMTIGGNGNWRDPAGNWPSGYPYTQNFRNSPRLFFPLFKATGWPGYSAGNPVRDADQSTDDKGQGGTSRFMFSTFGVNVPGADDPSRNYKRPAQYTDATRTHLVYEAGWPTTSGVDFKVRTHQFTINEQNLNDFIVLEISMTNTGVVDSNNDGTPEAMNNVVDGVAMTFAADISPSVFIGTNGDRGGNRLAAGRTFGYVAAPDETGAPYNLFAWYANVPPTTTTNRSTPPAGQRSFGINDRNTLHGYTDIWNTWTWLGVKQGAIQDGNISAITASSVDKDTYFGTAPVGEGSRRGWYTSNQWQGNLGSRRASDVAFRNATATWYEDYGKTTDGNAAPVKLSPNPDFFSGGTADDITTFTVGNSSARPNGDFKYASEDLSNSVAINQPIWEPAWNPDAATGNFYSGGIGYTKEYTFGENLGSGIGPFELQVGESLTIVWVWAEGYRFEGISDAVKAARWAWENGWDVRSALPVPATPDIKTESTADGTAVIRWTDVSSITPVDGYKIWRAAQFRRTDYLDQGMRLVDRYHHQHDVDEQTGSFLDPVNPNFDAESIFQGDIQGTYQPAEWGTYELIKKIPAGELSLQEDATDGYDFSFEDQNAITGFTYWYYVSAYKEGSFTGPLGPVEVNHIESSNMNRNGRNGPDAQNGEISLNSQWFGTYPFAVRNADFPAPQEQGFKNIGAEFTVTPPVAPVDKVKELITVSPNPYKITGLNDVRNDPASHNINFLNLPENYRLTIIDVSGQIIFQNRVTGAVDGKFTWDMFSKDGVEVSSGLYIYHVEYEGGAVTGHFAILR